MREGNHSFLNVDIEVDDKVGGEGVDEKLGPIGRTKRKLINLTF